MTAADQERYRLAILQQCAAAGAMGITLDNILPGMSYAGFRTTRSELEDVITRDLKPARYVAEVVGRFSAAHNRYVLTTEGRGLLAEMGLA